MVSGQDVMEPNLTVLLTLYSAQVKLFIQPEGKAQLKEQVAYYMRNAHVIYDGLKEAGYSVSGGVNAPYIWLKTPDNMSSWDFFDYLLENAHVVGTPGSGFGAHGEGFFRLTAFGSYENTQEALRRIKALYKFV